MEVDHGAGNVQFPSSPARQRLSPRKYRVRRTTPRVRKRRLPCDHLSEADYRARDSQTREDAVHQRPAKRSRTCPTKKRGSVSETKHPSKRARGRTRRDQTSSTAGSKRTFFAVLTCKDDSSFASATFSERRTKRARVEKCTHFHGVDNTFPSVEQSHHSSAHNAFEFFYENLSQNMEEIDITFRATPSEWTAFVEDNQHLEIILSRCGGINVAVGSGGERMVFHIRAPQEFESAPVLDREFVFTPNGYTEFPEGLPPGFVPSVSVRLESNDLYLQVDYGSFETCLVLQLSMPVF